jgi:hypothetical protein
MNHDRSEGNVSNGQLAAHNPLARSARPVDESGARQVNFQHPRRPYQVNRLAHGYVPAVTEK